MGTAHTDSVSSSEEAQSRGHHTVRIHFDQELQALLLLPLLAQSHYRGVAPAHLHALHGGPEADVATQPDPHEEAGGRGEDQVPGVVSVGRGGDHGPGSECLLHLLSRSRPQVPLERRAETLPTTRGGFLEVDFYFAAALTAPHQGGALHSTREFQVKEEYFVLRQ